MNKIKEVVKSRKKPYNSLKYLASRIGSSKTDMSNYIANRRTIPNDKLVKLVNILNCKVTDLFPNAKKRTKTYWELNNE